MKIKQTKNGFTTVVYLGTIDKVPVRKRFTASTKEELRKMVGEAQYRIEMQAAQKKSLGLTLYEAFGKYIDAREHLLSPASVKRYRGIQKHSFQSLMKKDILKLKKSEVQEAVNLMALSESPKTVRDKVSLLNAVLKEFRGDPFEVYLPQKEKHELYIPTKAEVDKLLEFVTGTEWEAPIVLAALCGLRRSEIAALTWDDVDFEHDTLRINKALGITEDKGFQLKKPKTYAGYRKVDMPERVKIVLQRLSEERLPILGISINSVSNKFPGLLRRADLHPFRFHDLRHYFASRLLALGVPDLYVIKIIGHSTTSMLEHYQHVLSDEDRKYHELIRTNL